MEVVNTSTLYWLVYFWEGN